MSYMKSQLEDLGEGDLELPARKCSDCGEEFEPEKHYWRMCSDCARNKFATRRNRKANGYVGICPNGMFDNTHELSWPEVFDFLGTHL